MGDSGPAVIPGKPEESLLLEAVRREEGVSAMPPDQALSAEEIRALEEWIRQGAMWPVVTKPFETSKHWAFEPIKDVPPSEIQQKDWPLTSIDGYILNALEKEGLKPAARADRRTLIRRVTYDLTGLPPTPEEVEAYLADTRPEAEAYKAVVERLLASPRYGEHWGRHWLDIVRYADTAGENSDHPLPHAWKYRNWVIQAINKDQPYDQFLRDQIAGDLLPKDVPREMVTDRIVATGYLAIARRFGHDIDKDMHLTYEDTIDTLGKSVLGLTLGCCRCHDHKYDPVSSKDYYGLYGIFESTQFAFPGCEPKQQPRHLVPLAMTDEDEEKAIAIDVQIAVVDEEILQRKAEDGAAAQEI
ncbi:MAG: DUF1549 domain-containing protein, partial [Planctomycetaceae bacterium]|nr:DUF1549 domain-containing protein [Planctomycetaceae bacterium]